MRNSVVGVFVGVAVLLILGLFFYSSADGLFPYIRQVSDDAGATGTITDEKAIWLVLLIGAVLGGIVSMGIGLGITVRLLNHQVREAQQMPAQPFPLLTGGTDTRAAASTLVDNAPYVVMGIGVLMLVIIAIVYLAF